MQEDSQRSAIPWKGLFVALGLGFVVYAVLGLITDFGDVAQSLEDFAFQTFGFALALAFANYVIRFVKWQYYLGLLKISVPTFQSFIIFLAGFLMSVTPAKVGEVLRSLLLKESHDIPIERTAPIVIADRLSDLLALLVLMSAGAATFQQGWLIMLVGFGFCLVVILAVQIPWFGYRLIAIAKKIPVIKRGGDKFTEAYESLRTVGSAKVLLIPLLLSIVGWFCECFAFYVVLHGFSNASIDLFTATFIYSLASVAGAVALLPGGLGATEASMAGMIVALPTGLSSAQGASATVLIRLATLWFAVVLGLIALPIHKSLLKKKG